MGMERELLNKVAVVHQQSVIWTENLLIGHPLGTQRDRFKYLSAVIEVIEGLVLKISDHPCQKEVIPCECSSQGHEAVAVFSDKTVALCFSNSGVWILINKSFPHLSHHGAGRFALDLEGRVAQKLLDFPAIQTGSDS